MDYFLAAGEIYITPPDNKTIMRAVMFGQNLVAAGARAFVPPFDLFQFFCLPGGVYP